MLTSKEFKTANNLSDSSFSRLVSKLKTAHPELVLTERKGSRDWIINYPEIFQDALPVKTSSETVSEPEIVEAELIEPAPIPSSSIQLLDQSQNSQLQALADRFGRKAFMPVSLNGSQESSFDLVLKLAATAENMTVENQRIQADLEVRRQANELAEQALRGIAATIKTQAAVNAELQVESSEVSNRDNDLKKQLDLLSKFLS